MKVLRKRRDTESNVQNCLNCSTIVEFEDSDLRTEYNPRPTGRQRFMYEYVVCPECGSFIYLSREEETTLMNLTRSANY